MDKALRILIVAEHASARFGGEAALPLHYFRVLEQRGVPVWLVSHARTRDELAELYPGSDRIIYIEDTGWHRLLWRLGTLLPASVAYMTTGFLSRLSTQLAQRRIVRRMVKEQAIDVVHQPMPVSPREPSMLYGFGVPVVIGPMNGGMDYPTAFRRSRAGIAQWMLQAGRGASAAMNTLMPGKRRASVLLVANERTRLALPKGVSAHVVELVENGVDLSLWRDVDSAKRRFGQTTTFVFMGRLVEWKAVDLLLRAFAQARTDSPMRLWILGDGDQRAPLESLARSLDLPIGASQDVGAVFFSGWLTQAACVARLSAADCLVLPSLLECGGAVVLEAMSLAKPVIATAWGGPLDYLDSTCGVLVEPVSATSLVDRFATAMVALAHSPETRARMGEQALQKVRKEFDWDLKVDRMMDVYRDAIERQGQRPTSSAAH